MKTKTIFVTVGTTLFEELIECMTQPQVLQTLADLGFTDMVIQYGKGRPPSPSSNASPPPLRIHTYRFKPTLRDDLIAADWVVGHAGAGTVSETLALGGDKKKLIVVINTQLMDNHQTELAYAMRDRHHCVVVDEPRDLLQSTTWDTVSQFTPTPLMPGDADDFPRLLHTFL